MNAKQCKANGGTWKDNSCKGDKKKYLSYKTYLKFDKYGWRTYTCIALIAIAAIMSILKIKGAIAWSWWWVLSPIWIPVALFVLLLIFTILLAFGYEVFVNKGRHE